MGGSKIVVADHRRAGILGAANFAILALAIIAALCGPAYAEVTPGTRIAPGCTVLTCSCTKLGYWSSTPAQGGVGGIWYVLFDSGSVFTNPQGSARNVRAVRGGS